MGRRPAIDRERVLGLAEDILLRDGPRGLTIEALAKAAGVSKGGGVHPSAWTEVVVWALPAPGSLGFSAALGDRSVELSWNRPGQGYTAEVEKQNAKGEWRGLTGLDQKSGRYSDFDVEYEKTYVYRARLVRLKDQTKVLGPWSPDRSVRVIDVVPPNPPGYLDAALAVARRIPVVPGGKVEVRPVMIY